MSAALFLTCLIIHNFSVEGWRHILDALVGVDRLRVGVAATARERGVLSIGEGLRRDVTAKLIRGVITGATRPAIAGCVACDWEEIGRDGSAAAVRRLPKTHRDIARRILSVLVAAALVT